MKRAHLGLVGPLLACSVALIVVPSAVGMRPGSPPGTGGSGGAGLAGGSGARAAVQPANMTVSATDDGITLTTTASALVRHTVQFDGAAPAGDAGATVVVERLGPGTRSRWVATASGTVGATGFFSLAWLPGASGLFSFRAVIAAAGSQTVSADTRRNGGPSGGAATGAGTSAGTGAGTGAGTTPGAGNPASGGTPASGGAGASSPAPGATSGTSLKVTVYKPAVATFYGPGFFGHQTACGERLTRDTLGVANLQLRCGTMVEIYYRGQAISVPVIDRGPYAAGVSWDLTEATAHALGIVTTVTIGVVAAPVKSGGAGLPGH